MPELENKTPEELELLITEATAQLETIQREKRKEVIAQIKELAASINVTVDIIEDSKKSKKAHVTLPVKYINPNNPTEVWTGRGVAPKWMQLLIKEGHKKVDFLVSKFVS